MTQRLVVGDRLPRIDLELLDRGLLAVPDGLDARWTALVFYRGHW
jgi:hypothetical protein